ncbi:helix-loop-helix protein delilah-like [Homarus americanus]|uniref:helix-loop-helix protein delilah-like n=1 Tax=Homarus americanus TaxID=6706 RepID=UPI001C440EAB|nr:helix-loop-helix protein delilah-like [Homarus americanus]
MIDRSRQVMEGYQEQRRDDPSTDTNNNTRNTRSGEKYALRPRTIIKRLQHEIIRKEVPKRSPRSKTRPAPLSKYRRKTANARERHRMKEINNAFESLRKVLPDAMEVHTSSSSMTKITTLRLAVDYIRALSHVLEDTSDADLCTIQSTLQSSIQDSLHSSLQESLQQSFQYSLQKITPSSGSLMTTFQYQHSTSHLPQQHLPQYPQLLGYCTTPSTVSLTSSPCADRKSLGSASDLEELLSDDSGLLEDNLDVFHDIPTLAVADPFEILLVSEKDGGLSFTSELCN